MHPSICVEPAFSPVQLITGLLPQVQPLLQVLPVRSHDVPLQVQMQVPVQPGGLVVVLVVVGASVVVVSGLGQAALQVSQSA
jgi:hypothetical protein